MGAELGSFGLRGVIFDRRGRYTVVGEFEPIRGGSGTKGRAFPSAECFDGFPINFVVGGDVFGGVEVFSEINALPATVEHDAEVPVGSVRRMAIAETTATLATGFSAIVKPGLVGSGTMPKRGDGDGA